MDALLHLRMADSKADLYADATVWLGDVFHDRELTQVHLDELIYPALDALAMLEKEYGGGFTPAAVEMKASFPGVPTTSRVRRVPAVPKGLGRRSG